MGFSPGRSGTLGILAALTLAAALAACGPLPRPFQPPPAPAANPLVTEVATSGVWIERVDGTTLPLAMLLTESVAAGFKLYGIPATTDNRSRARYRLRGRAEINATDPDFPFVALINWTLLDHTGRVVGTARQGIPGSRRDWEYGSPRVIREVGENAPELIANLIEKEEEDLKPAGPSLAGLWVSPVENAPGDGDRSLTRAIKAAIKGAGIPVAGERRYAEFVLQGRVGLGPAKDGLQRIEIVWAVSTPDGREIGRATQRNLVEAGTFDGPWGGVATIVADAALGGIEGVLRVAGPLPNRFGTLARVLKTAVPLSAGEGALPPPRLELDGLHQPLERPGKPGQKSPPPG
ncbi:MAG: hypothetical protein ACE5GT_01060 [Rhodospirillales bacterium]